MRGSESTYDELDTDDQVVDMARIIRRDFLDKVSEGGSLEDRGVVDTVLADVLSSKALQEQAIKFVVGILENKEVKAAGQRFLKDLWDDLVKDPETTAQVIFLLNVAIQNDDIRLAVKRLVLEIVEDEEVLEELVRLLQKLGQDQEVRDRIGSGVSSVFTFPLNMTCFGPPSPRNRYSTLLRLSCQKVHTMPSTIQKY